MHKGILMFSRRRVLLRCLLAIMMLGVNLCGAKAFAQKLRMEATAYTAPTLNLISDRSVVSSCLGDATSALVRLNAKATSSDGHPIVYRWTSPVGRIVSDGTAATWDLSGLKPGYYEAFVEIDTGNGDSGCQAFSSIGVLVECPPPPPPPCPNVSISCPDRVQPGQSVTFSSTLAGSLGDVNPAYRWTISNGRIIDGQGTSSIRVDTTGLEGQTLTATLSMGGYSLDCSAACSVQFPAPLSCRSFDEFPALARNDEKARLDNFAIELQNDPSTRGYVIVNPREQGRTGEVQTRSKQIVDYLVYSRRLDGSRMLLHAAGHSDRRAP